MCIFSSAFIFIPSGFASHFLHSSLFQKSNQWTVDTQRNEIKFNLSSTEIFGNFVLFQLSRMRLIATGVLWSIWEFFSIVFFRCSSIDTMIVL